MSESDHKSREIIMCIFACGFHQIVFSSQIAWLCSRRQCGKVSKVSMSEIHDHRRVFGYFCCSLRGNLERQTEHICMQGPRVPISSVVTMVVVATIVCYLTLMSLCPNIGDVICHCSTARKMLWTFCSLAF